MTLQDRLAGHTFHVVFNIFTRARILDCSFQRTTV